MSDNISAIMRDTRQALENGGGQNWITWHADERQVGREDAPLTRELRELYDECKKRLKHANVG